MGPHLVKFPSADTVPRGDRSSRSWKTSAPTLARLLAGMAFGLALLLIATTHSAHAQTPPAPPPRVATPAPLQPGDVVWTFAPEPPFMDERIAGALGALIAPRLDATPGTRIVRVTPQPSGYEVGFVAAASDVTKLFAAAGYADPSTIREVGQCRAWAAPPPAGTSATTPPAAFEARPRLIAALGEALGSLGIHARPCVATDIVAEAHVLIWQHGGPPPALTRRSEPTFLWSQGGASGTPPPPQPGGTVGRPPAPRPAATGSAGLRAESSDRALPAAALLAVTLLVGAARTRTRGGSSAIWR